ncbi:amino acid adenylation domain-containing protein [Paenibacillus polysaccharolyticus]|uniref:amino acid adenylation domain-containing protein n=1 Tax=Paenibacillus polysaccharolyticus TaxID=582692 RepID=UPI0020A02805|nr:non-ribosomal peptide synthetase [Paenibacillus polysaccharolyticus]MCP1132754.1 amino acid adenylation domain-containing protein [Paenibacillus polysaccharolyticus]
MSDVQRIDMIPPIQAGLMYHLINDQQQEGAYVEQFVIDINGIFHYEKFVASLREISQYHEILRTYFEYEDVDQPVRVVKQEGLITVNYSDASSMETCDQEQFLQTHIEKDRLNPFSVSAESILRFSVVTINDQSFKLICSYHHALIDGYSFQILLKDILMNYESHIQSDRDQRVLIGTSDEGYIKWLNHQNWKDASDYWYSYMSGYDANHSIPTLRYQNCLPKYKELEITVESSLFRALFNIALEHRVTINVIFQAIWSMMLQRYTNSEDVVYGLVTSLRDPSIDDIEHALGVFVNTIPMRVRTDSNTTFSAIIKNMQEDMLRSRQYGYYPLHQIQADSEIAQELINHILIFNNHGDSVKTEISYLQNLNNQLSELQVINIAFSSRSHYPLEIVVDVYDNKASMLLSYDSNIYDEQLVDLFKGHFFKLAELITEKKVLLLSDFDLLTPGERQELLPETKFILPEYSSVFQMFEKQAVTHPHRTAIVSCNRELNYQELLNESMRLSNVLLNSGLDQGSAIGLLFDRNDFFVVSVLAVLRSGFHYVPLDPEAPQDRNLYIIEDSDIQLIFSESQIFSIQGSEIRNHHHLLIDKVNSCNIELSASPTAPIVDSSQKAYIIYTSGTTGKPKGVEIQHRSIINLVIGLTKEIYAPFDERLNVAQLAPFFFDQSIEEIFGSILLGHTLVIATNEERLEYEKLLQFLDNHTIELMNGSPSYIRSLLVEERTPHSLRRLLIGGETVPYQLLMDLFHSPGYKNLEVFNVYGPTECCVDATYYKVNLDEIQRWKTTPIGRPMINKNVYILDKYDRLQPVGIPGELVIGGEGLAVGYTGLSQMTYEKFKLSPFNDNEMVYRTGDQAKWLASGQIDFLGRTDRLVKLHGYRIELEEIEKCLLNHEDVQEAIVLLKETESRKYLCSFIVSTEGRELSEYHLKLWASEILPHYMTPTKFVFLSELPLSDRGKVDIRLLEQMDIETEIDHVPLTPMVSTIIKIWEDIFKIEDIQPRDHFFELGGHSLYATMFISKIKRNLGVNVSIKDLFIYPTPFDFAGLIEQKQTQDTYDAVVIEQKQELTQQYYPLTPAQTRMFLMCQMNKESTKYNISGRYRINRKMVLDKLRSCFNTLLTNHEILRTKFTLVDGAIIPTVLHTFDIELQEWDCPPETSQWIRPFDLDIAPLLRVSVLEVDAHSFDLYIDMHHIVTDGISNVHLMSQFIQLYNDEQVKHGVASYQQYAYWFENYLNSTKLQEDQDYWAKKMAGELTEDSLLVDYSRMVEQEGKSETVWIEIEANMTNALRKLALDQETTLFSVLLATYNVLLYKYNSQEEVILGTAVSGRTQHGFEDSIGLFVNTIVLRNYPSGEKIFSHFLNEVSQSLMEDLDHQDYPFDHLIDQLSIRRDRARNPIFDIMFIMQNRTRNDQHISDQDYIIEYPIASSEAKFDLLIEAYEYNDTIKVKLEFNSSLYERNTIERHGSYLLSLLSNIIAKPQEQLANLSFMEPNEFKHLLNSFDRSMIQYPNNQTIHNVFEEQVTRTPENIAVSYQGETLTYLQLNERSNQLANYLIRKGVDSGQFIGIYLEKSIDAIISILAVLKAGAAYIPINKEYPNELIMHILKDSCVELVIADRPSPMWNEMLKSGQVLFVSDLFSICLTEEKGNLEIEVSADQIAYIIYTSGTTGKPKGVMIEHANVVRLFVNAEPFFPFHEQEVWTMYHALSFDYSVWEMYGALLKGAKLIIVPDSVVYNSQMFFEMLVKEKVTVLNQTPAALYVLINAISDRGSDLSLKYIISSAEALHPRRLLDFHKAYPHIRIMNIYGITETTVFTTYKNLKSEDIESDNRSIGKPISTLSLYLLNKDKQLCPRGGIGELYVGGAGVARGYFNRDRLNEERFVENPFIPGKKMYRSGDLMRVLPNDELEYIGRIDHQVKIRGYRIELADIEKNVMTYPQIYEAMVLSIGVYPNNYLCAFYVAEQSLPKNELKNYLMLKLPAYSVPFKYVYLNEFPITLNGKIDRKRLIELAEDSQEDQKNLPRDESELKIASHWSNLLGKDEIGIEEDFFELGGNSLQAIQLADSLQKEFEKNLTIKDIFENPTISLQTKVVLEAASLHNTNVISKYDKSGTYYPLSSAQKRIFLLSQNPDIGMSYNIVTKFDLFGQFDRSLLKTALETIVQRHSVLRYGFGYERGIPVQFISKAEPEIFWFETGEKRREQIMDEFLQPYDVTSGEILFSTAVIRIEEEHHVLILNMHHLISDGVSMNIFEQELKALLNGEKLPSLESDYQDYVLWQLEQYQGQVKANDEKFWCDSFKGYVPETNVPLQKNIQNFKGELISFEIPEGNFEKLRMIAIREKTTLFNVLMTLYKSALYLLWNQQDIVVGTPVSGRTNQQFAGTMGMFVNTLAIRSKADGAMTFKEYLDQIKETMQQALEHQAYPLDELIETLGTPTTAGHSPLFRFMFAYEIAIPTEFKINELKVVTDENISDGSAMIDLSFVILEDATQGRIQIEYNTSQFRRETVQFLFETFNQITEIVLHDYHIRLDEIYTPNFSDNGSVWNDQQFEFNF